MRVLQEREVQELVWSGVELCNELFELPDTELKNMKLDEKKSEILLKYSRECLMNIDHKAETQRGRMKRSKFLLILSKQVDWKYRLKSYLYNTDDWNTIKLQRNCILSILF